MNHLPQRRAPRSISPVVLVVAVAALLVGCVGTPGISPPANPGHSMPTAASLGPRPSSPATVEIVNPAPGEIIVGDTAHVVLTLTGGRIITETTTALRPDEGHLHLYVDNALVSMNYGLEQIIPVTAGSHVVKAEFVAADHAPFSPRVWSPENVFTVRQ